jgi:hypothetical protein
MTLHDYCPSQKLERTISQSDRFAQVRMGRRKHCSMPVQHIRVKVNEDAEVFELKRELLTCRANAIARMEKLRAAAARVVKEHQKSTVNKQNMLESFPLSPDLSLIRSPIEGPDIPQPPMVNNPEQLEGESFMAEFSWFSREAH